jgi:hypothetical protein
MKVEKIESFYILLCFKRTSSLGFDILKKEEGSLEVSLGLVFPICKYFGLASILAPFFFQIQGLAM